MRAKILKFAESFLAAESKISWVGNQVKWRVFSFQLRRQDRANREFDARYGVDTASEVSLEMAGVPKDEAVRGNGLYRPLWDCVFRHVMASLPLDFREYTFVDIGSGKGKLLLLASDYPFKKIIGVEYAPLLHKIAERNVAVYRSANQKCMDMVPILGDALQYSIPDGPVVCIIFNSFESSTMKKVLEKIDEDAGSGNRPAYVIYANVRSVSELGDVFGGLRNLRPVVSRSKYVILGNRMPLSRTAGG